jgi:copper(I)-binding protein
MSRRAWWAPVAGGDADPGRRVHPALLAAVLTAVVGAAGLWYGHSSGAGAAGAAGGAGGQPAASPAGQPLGQDGGSGSGGSAGSGSGTATVGDITVRGGYLREPVRPDAASGYLSISNTGKQSDTLLSAYCGAARSTAVRDVPPGPVTIGPGRTVSLSPGHGRLLLSGLTGALRPGDSVSLLLTFQRTGQLLVQLPVLAVGELAPDGSRR